jgi:hypothetical protein
MDDVTWGGVEPIYGILNIVILTIDYSVFIRITEEFKIVNIGISVSRIRECCRLLAFRRI